MKERTQRMSRANGRIMRPSRMAVMAAGVVGALLLSSCGGGGSGSAAGGDRKFLTLAAGGDSGSWYVGSSVISEIVNKQLPGVRMNAQPGGGVANMETLQQGDARFGYMFGSTAHEALQGTGPFEKEHKKIRAVMNLIPSYAHIVVPANSDIHAVEDLIGKTVSPGKQGFGGAAAFKSVMDEYGIALSDMNVKYLDYSDATQLMRDGQIDALFSTSGLGHSPYKELGSTVGIRLVPISAKHIESFIQDHPGWEKGRIPGGVYPGIEGATPTLKLWAGLATTADTSEELVYNFTKAVYENRKKLAEAYPAYKATGPDSAVRPSLRKAVPLHPGARKYWRETGLLGEGED